MRNRDRTWEAPVRIKRPGRLMCALLFALLWMFTPGGWSAERGVETRPVKAQGDDLGFELAHHEGGIVRSVKRVGDRLLVGVGPRLSIFDASDALAPQLLGKTIPLEGRVTRVEPSGDHVVVLLHGVGLRVVDAGNPSAPQVVGALNVEGWSRDLTLHETTAYIASSTDGLRVIDLSAPTNPIEGQALRLEGARGLTVADGRLLVVDGTQLHVFDVSSPIAQRNPVALGSYTGFSSASFVAASADGQLAYVGSGGTLHVMDIRDPAGPEGIIERSSLVIGTIGGLSVEGDTVVASNNGINFIDVSDPDNPISTTNLASHRLTYGVDAVDDLAYLADEHRIGIYDFSDIHAPHQSLSLPSAGYARDMVLANELAYVADWQYGLRVLDLSDIDTPTQIAQVPMSNVPIHLTLAGDQLYSLTDRKGLAVFDVSLPDQPAQLAELDTIGLPQDLVVHGDHAFVAESVYAPEGRSGGLSVIDVSEPTQPWLAARINFNGTESARALAIQDDHLYLFTDRDGLRVYDISDPLHMARVGRLYAAQGYVTGAHAAGSYVFAADTNSGLKVIDVSDPTQPRLMARVDHPETTPDVFVDRNTAYLASAQSGLRILDISDPAAPVELGRLATPNIVDSVVVHAGTAIVAQRDQGLRFIDLTEPSSPHRVAEIDLLGSVGHIDLEAGQLHFLAGQQLRSVRVNEDGTFGRFSAMTTSYFWPDQFDVSGDHAYIFDSGRLHVYDLSNPDHPMSVSNTLLMSGFSGDMHVVGNYAYLSVQGNDAGLYVADVSDPAAPVLVGSLLTPGETPTDLRASGGHIYLIDATDGDPMGLRVVDVSDPSQPVTVAQLPVAGRASGVAVQGTTVYIADWEGLLRVIDVSDPTQPVETGSLPFEGENLFTVAANDQHAFVSLDLSGMAIVDVSDPTDPKAIEIIEMPDRVVTATTDRGLAIAASADAGLYVFQERVQSIPTATALASATPMATNTPPTSPTEGAEPQVSASTIFLPIAVARAGFADPEDGRAHISMLFDTSRSMALPLSNPAGISRLEAARELGLELTEQIDLDRHSLGVVRFDRQAELLATGRERRGIERAIGSLESGPVESRIDLALAAALDDLERILGQEAEPVCGNAVLVTDAASEAQHRGEILERAQQLQVIGAQLYAVALGGSADLPFLAEITGSRDRVQAVPDLETLEALSRELTVEFAGCGGM